MDEDDWVLEDHLHFFGIGHKIGRKIAAIKLHAFDHFQDSFCCLCLLDGDHSILSDLLHRVGHQFANRSVVVGGYSCNLCLLQAARNRTRKALQRLDGDPKSSIESALQVDRARARCHVVQSLGKDRVRQYGGSARAIAHCIPCALRCLANHLGSEVLFRVFEFNLFGDCDAVVANNGAAPFLSMRTHFDFGPSVTLTASVSAVAPFRTFSRAADLKRRRLNGIVAAPFVRVIDAYGPRTTLMI